MNVLTVKKKLFICEITIYIYIYEMGRQGQPGRPGRPGRCQRPVYPERLGRPKLFAKTAKLNFAARPAANLICLDSGRNSGMLNNQ